MACAAYGCTNRPSKKVPGITFHRFPTNEQRKAEWIRAVRRANWKPAKWSILCSQHFPEEMIDRTSLCCVRLREHAVPVIFNFDVSPSYLKSVTTRKSPDTNKQRRDRPSKKSITTRKSPDTNKQRRGRPSKKSATACKPNTSEQGRVRPSKKSVKESRSELNFNDLPKDIHREIFQYFDKATLCRIRRVCKTWCDITKDETFWRKTECHIECLCAVTQKVIGFINILPSYVTHLNLSFSKSLKFFYRGINLMKFFKKIRDQCPDLQTLILQNATFDNLGDLNIYTHLPANIKVLVFHYCYLKQKRTYNSDSGTPKIEVLDISSSGRIYDMFLCSSKFPLLPCLKKLRITGNTDFQIFSCITDISFVSLVESSGHQLILLDLECRDFRIQIFCMIYTHCINLRELYVCYTNITDKDLMFDEPETVLPNLKIICFRNCDVTRIGIQSFMKSCKSVEHIYVGSKDGKDNFSDLNFKKIHFLNNYEHCQHHKKVNYMLE